jgi:ATP-dependent protease HslVU (ClpYQ) peptidase subunit
MTTIATDGRTMAADTHSSTGGLIVNRSAVKVTRAKDGSLVGVAGDCSGDALFRRWLDDGEQQDKLPNFRGADEFVALVLRPDGRLDAFDSSLVPVEYQLPAAIGSGGQLALGAMLAGRSPAQAVAIAAQRDNATGEFVVELELKP